MKLITCIGAAVLTLTGAAILTVLTTSIQRQTSSVSYEKGWPLTASISTTDGIGGPVVYSESFSYINNLLLNYLFYIALLIACVLLLIVQRQLRQAKKRS